jgi:hypothetical protein
VDNIVEYMQLHAREDILVQLDCDNTLIQGLVVRQVLMFVEQGDHCEKLVAGIELVVVVADCSVHTFDSSLALESDTFSVPHYDFFEQ